MSKIRAFTALLLAAFNAQAQVDLRESDDFFYLSNNSISVSIDKRTGSIEELRVGPGPNLLAGEGYMDFNGAAPGDTRSRYERFGAHTPVVGRIFTRSKDIVNIGFVPDVDRLDENATLPIRHELHYVIKSGVPGVYIYWASWRNETMPTFTLEQMRYVVRASRQYFDLFQLGRDSVGTFPSTEELSAATTIYDATFRLPNGRYVTKYVNSRKAEQRKLFGVYGSGDRIGLWQISPNDSYVNGVPNRSELTVHEEEPILLHTSHAGHYLGPSSKLSITGSWAKLSGPFLIFVTQSTSRNEAWQLAKRRLNQERNLSIDPLIQLTPLVRSTIRRRRGQVHGRVVQSDGKPAARAYVVINRIVDGVTQEGYADTFYARSSDHGRFRIDDVVPGVFRLTAYKLGIFGEGRKAKVRVRSSGSNAIGRVKIGNMNGRELAGSTLWEIGVPNRSVSEFRRGREVKTVLLKDRYPEDFPDDVTFRVGLSDPSVDWNYYHPGGRTWKVRFNLSPKQVSDALLAIAIADTSHSPAPQVQIAVNENALPPLNLDPGGNALWRLGDEGRYQVVTAEIPVSFLKVGENEMTLRPTNEKAWVMYDYLRFYS